MAEPAFTASADEALGTVEADAGRAGLADALWRAIDAICADPAGGGARQRRYHQGSWGVPVRWRDDNWLVLWEPAGDDVVILYVGPDI